MQFILLRKLFHALFFERLTLVHIYLYLSKVLIVSLFGASATNPFFSSSFHFCHLFFFPLLFFHLSASVWSWIANIPINNQLLIITANHSFLFCFCPNKPKAMKVTNSSRLESITSVAIIKLFVSSFYLTMLFDTSNHLLLASWDHQYFYSPNINLFYGYFHSSLCWMVNPTLDCKLICFHFGEKKTLNQHFMFNLKHDLNQISKCEINVFQQIS